MKNLVRRDEVTLHNIKRRLVTLAGLYKGQP